MWSPGRKDVVGVAFVVCIQLLRGPKGLPAARFPNVMTARAKDKADGTPVRNLPPEHVLNGAMDNPTAERASALINSVGTIPQF